MFIIRNRSIEIIFDIDARNSVEHVDTEVELLKQLVELQLNKRLFNKKFVINDSFDDPSSNHTSFRRLIIPDLTRVEELSIIKDCVTMFNYENNVTVLGK